MHRQLLAHTLHSEAALTDMVLRATQRAPMPQTVAALSLARQCHQGQYRKGEAAIPYITHPLATACHALSLGIQEDDLIAALLLHDVIEDSGLTATDLPVSPAAAEAVRLVSKAPGYIEAEYYAAIAENSLSCLVKLFDRCHNIACMAYGFSRAKMASYLEETSRFILPLFAAAEALRPDLALPLWQLRYQLLSQMDAITRLL